MDIQKVLALRGPNIWSRRTVLEAWVDLGDLRDAASNTIPGFFERLAAWLPGLEEHRCGLGVRGGFFIRLREGTYPAHVLEHVTIELQNLAGTPVGFGKARETSRPGVYRVVVRYREEAVGRACLWAARDLVLAAMRDEPFDVAGTIARLRDVADEAMLGPSTRAVVDAAEARDIPWARLGEGSLVMLGHGARRRRVRTTETDRTGAVAESVAQDKELTRRFLRTCGVPVPAGRLVGSPEEAWEAAQDLGLPVVVKPRDGNHGRGVYLELTTREEVEAAFEGAAREGSGVLVERFVPGEEHRVLVVGGRVVAAARGPAAWVTGDGRTPVRGLIEAQLNADPRRGVRDECPLNPVEVDDTVVMELRRQGLTPDSVPGEGRRVLIQRNGNLADDVTDRVHEEVAARAILAARVVGLDVAGVDIVTPDIARPLEDVGGAVVEVNAGPALHAHLKPTSGEPRSVGAAIVESLFPPGEDGRIPLACVTGVRRRSEVARRVFAMLRASGWAGLGFAASDGLFLDDRRIAAGDHADFPGARRLLWNPALQAAVVEAHPAGILAEGLGFDQCSVAAVTDIGDPPPDLGYPFVETREDLFTVLRCPVDVVRPGGVAVLDAGEPLLLDMVPLCAGHVTLVAADPDAPALGPHLAAGGRAVTVRKGRIVFQNGEGTADAGEVPRGDDVLVALYGAAIGWALGLAPGEVAAGLARGMNADPAKQIVGSRV